MKKQEHLPSLTELNRTLDKISHNGKIGHLFIADIKSNEHSMKYTSRNIILLSNLNLKINFVVMNQKSRQKATSPVERDFFKLLNSNFGIDY